MRREIYHGSDHILRNPRFGVGNAYNDFGLGFYCSLHPQYAAEWATETGINGFVSTYSMEDDGLRIINLCSSQYSPLHWLSVLFNYREFGLSSALGLKAREYILENFPVDIQGCDCIIGYRADNSCFAVARDFLEGSISLESLTRSLTGHNANRQFVIKSNRAFDRIIFTGSGPAFSADHYSARISRELKLLKNSGQSQSESGLFVRQMIDEDIKPYDARIR